MAEDKTDYGKLLQHMREQEKTRDLTQEELESLKPWQFKFAQWQVNHHLKVQRIDEQVKAASLFAGADIKPSALKALRENRVFQLYKHKLRENAREAAAERFWAAAPEMVDIHIDAAKGLHEAQEYKSIAAFTQPYIDRIVPKKDEQANQNVVNVVLSVKQAEAIDEEIPEVEYEVIEDGEKNGD